MVGRYALRCVKMVADPGEGVYGARDGQIIRIGMRNAVLHGVVCYVPGVWL